MKVSDITFTVIALLLSVALFLILLYSGALQRPRDLKDKYWGTLPAFDATIPETKYGMHRDDVLRALKGLPTTALTDGSIECRWECRHPVDHDMIVCRVYEFRFDPSGVLTNRSRHDDIRFDRNDTDFTVIGSGTGKVIRLIFR